MKKEKADLEQLLNSLIEKGWKPFGRNSNKAYYRPEGPDEFYFGENGYGYIYNRRQIVSKESGLWQFVCENEMRPKRVGYEEHYWQRDNHTNGRGMAMESEPEYRLIETSLKNEDELEQFLLDNIKIDVESN